MKIFYISGDLNQPPPVLTFKLSLKVQNKIKPREQNNILNHICPNIETTPGSCVLQLKNIVTETS